MIKAIKLNASGSSTNIYGLVEFSKRPFRQDFPSEKCEVACVNQVNKDKIVSELKSIPGLKGIMVCEDGDNGAGSDILLYYGAVEGFHPELDQAIHRLEEGGLRVGFTLRDIGLVDLAITDCLDGKIAIKYETGHPFGVVNSNMAAEIHYGRILWESVDHPITAEKGKLVMQGTYPETLRQSTIACFMKETTLQLEIVKEAAFEGDIHFASAGFSQAIHSWVQVIHALNRQFLLNGKGSVKRAGRLPISPKQFRLRVNQIYRYFAFNNPKLAYCEIDMLKNEMNVLVKTFSEVMEG